MIEELYQENILDHYKNPRNKGQIKNPTFSAKDSNDLCGDIIQIDLKIKDDQIQEIKFNGQGCAISMASASILTELIKGKSLQEVRRLDKEKLLQELNISFSAIRIKCALLPLKVLKLAAYKEIIEI